MFKRYVFLTAFLTLTQPNGLPIHVHADAIEYVAEAIKGLADPRAHSEIQLESGVKIYVKQTPNEVLEKLEGTDDEVHSRAKGR